MEGNKRNFLNKHSNPQFKKKGGSRNGKQQRSAREQISVRSHVSETVYRILCQSKKIGGVIGKGGSIIKALREDTQAKISVAENVPGSDERVITIISPSGKQPKRRSDNDDGQDEKTGNVFEPHCVAQDALLKVHERIVEEELKGAAKDEEGDPVVTARLLVSNAMVGCLLGKKGDVIQRLRSETGANIRVLPAEHHPGCAMSDDQLVQLSGKPVIVKKALFEVSTRLHQNPRKDKPLISTPTSLGSHELLSPSLPGRHMLPNPHGNPPWLERTPNVQDMQSFRGYGIRPPEFGQENLGGVRPQHGHEAPSEFIMKILCSAYKIGGVIGTGGMNARQLEHETGTSIHVDNLCPVLDERVICISSFEVLRDQRSRTIEAVLQLQLKISEISENGTITTRLLVPSSKVGCIIGEGGHIINDMRRRTHAQIRVLSEEDKHKYALQDEELVQISGSFGVAKDALAEISSRLRKRCLLDSNSQGELVPVTSIPEFGRAGNSHGGSFYPSPAIIPGSSGRYEPLKTAFREYESPRFPVPAHAPGYLAVNEAKMSSMSAAGGSRDIEFAGSQLRRYNLYSTGPEIGNPQHVYPRLDSSTVPNEYPRSSYQGYNSQHVGYPSMHPSQVPYQNNNSQPLAYENNNYAPQSSYQNTRANSSYRY